MAHLPRFLQVAANNFLHWGLCYWCLVTYPILLGYFYLFIFPFFHPQQRALGSCWTQVILWKASWWELVFLPPQTIRTCVCLLRNGISLSPRGAAASSEFQCPVSSLYFLVVTHQGWGWPAGYSSVDHAHIPVSSLLSLPLSLQIWKEYLWTNGWESYINYYFNVFLSCSQISVVKQVLVTNSLWHIWKLKETLPC